MYGCGADDCKACYPYIYRCEDCLTNFPQPVANSFPYICENCGFDSSELD